MIRLTSILIATLCLGFYGCASPQGQGGESSQGSNATDDSAPRNFIVHDFRSDQRLSIVSDAWLRDHNVAGAGFIHRRANFYAEKRSGDGLMVKVVDDATANGIWEMLKATDFTDFAKAGMAPADGDIVQTLVVAKATGHVHMAARRGMPEGEGKAMRASVRGFMDLYNAIPQLQASEARPEFKGSAKGRLNGL
ncbi:MAG: hypothetical protein GY930_06595 [bacterium]|nr:hypothetical protein [bacterium]